MSQAAPHLRHIKSVFENHGIRNEAQITEYTAFLLLVYTHWEQLSQQPAIEIESLMQELYRALEQKYPALRLPQPPPVQQWGRESLNLIDGLQAAFDASSHNNSWGNLFQREIRFELLKGSSGGQYPTPYHIAAFMATLTLTGLKNDVCVFDPTAGTSGLLAACRAYLNVTTLVGCDLDPQIATIGTANLLLNQAENVTYHVGSALAYAQQYQDHFTAVLMNPPFGGNRAAYEVEQSVGREFGHSTATVLTALALQCLQPFGRAAILVPSGVLFGGGGDATLRQKLTKHNLEAIIRLPKGAFQPYSQVGANLLLFQKLPPIANTPSQPVWFCLPEGDGYDPGMGRDLTAEPAANTNGLPRVRDLLLQTQANQWQTRLSLTEGTIQTTTQQAENGLPGVAIRITEATEAIRWQATFLTDGLFVSLTDNTNATQGWLFESFSVESRQLAFHTLPVDTPPHSWANLVTNPSWDADLPAAWQGEQDNLSFTVNPKTHFSLNKFQFNKQPEATVQACLLSEQGIPLTPWLGCADKKLVEALNTGPEKTKLNAAPIYDGHGKRCAWLIDLTASLDDEDAVKGVLLLREGEDVLPYQECKNFYLTLNNGWITFTPTAVNAQVTFHTGQPITLSNNRWIDGFAVGPGVEGRGHHLFGLLVTRTEFVDAVSGHVGDLRPTRFFPEPEAPALDTPANLLANIRRNQESLKDRLDVLLKTLGKQTSPNLEAANLPSWITQLLGAEQRVFWTLLAQQKIDMRPAHFTLEHVKKWCATDGSLPYQEDDIQKQLDVLINLGLVQPVHVKGNQQDGDYYENLYRTLTEGDILPETEK